MIVLLEDNTEHADAVRRIVEPLGYSLLVGSDWYTALLLAENHARFFVLDIKLGEGPERVKGGLRALELLRLRYRGTVFVAILTALRDQHEHAYRKLGPDIAVQKSRNRAEDMRRILKAHEEWMAQEHSPGISGNRHIIGHVGDIEGTEADLLFPSDELAVQISGATLNDIARVLQDRISIARALGQKPPDRSDLEREIGARMRDELRGVLVELAERSRAEGKTEVALTNGPQLAGSLVRLILRVLPVTYNADNILEQLRSELQIAAHLGLSGEWGVVRIERNDQVLLDTSEGAFDEDEP